MIHARRRAVWLSIVRAKGAHLELVAEESGGLPFLHDPLELVAEILEVIWADAQIEYFLDHR